MAHAKLYEKTVATIADGSATDYVSVEQGGRILACIYTKVDYDAGVDFVITSEQTGQIIWDEDDVNADAVRCPMQAVHLNTSGAAALYAAAGTAVTAPIVVPPGRIKIVIAQGGNVKTGTFKFLVGDA